VVEVKDSQPAEIQKVNCTGIRHRYSLVGRANILPGSVGGNWMTAPKKIRTTDNSLLQSAGYIGHGSHRWSGRGSRYPCRFF